MHIIDGIQDKNSGMIILTEKKTNCLKRFVVSLVKDSEICKNPMCTGKKSFITHSITLKIYLNFVFSK